LLSPKHGKDVPGVRVGAAELMASTESAFLAHES